MSDFVEVDGRRYSVKRAELHFPLMDETRYIFLCVYLEPKGGFAAWYIEVPLLAGLDALDGPRIHIRADGFAYPDDTLGTDCIGADNWTDMNYWSIEDATYNWGELQLDFRRLDEGRFRVIVSARLSDGPEWDDSTAEEFPLDEFRIAARAELIVVPDEVDPVNTPDPELEADMARWMKEQEKGK